jgi:hypothetical protein
VVLNTIQCRGYRAFGRPTSLSLRAITVIFGKNNSGKTTLVRLPIFIMASSLDRHMYSLSALGTRFGASFTDLASVDQPHPRLFVGLSWDHDIVLACDPVQPLNLVTTTTSEVVHVNTVVVRIHPDNVMPDVSPQLLH